MRNVRVPIGFMVAGALAVSVLAACSPGSSAPVTTPASTTSVPTASSTASGPTISSSRSGPKPSSAAAVSATADLPAAELIASIPGVQLIAAGRTADWITVAGGSAWVANVDDGVARYDVRTGALLGSTLLGSNPASTNICLAMDATAESLWVGDCTTTTVVRVDLATGSVASTIDLPFDSIAAESSIAAGDGAVFALSGHAPLTIARIDQKTNAVTTFAAPPGARALRVGAGARWVSADTELDRLNPATGAVEATIPVSAGARFLTFGEGSVWVMSNDIVTRVDPVTNTVAASIPVTPMVVFGGDIAVGGGYVWARVSDVLVAKIAPATNTVVTRYGPPSGSGSVGADDQAVWISAHDVSSLWRVPLS